MKVMKDAGAYSYVQDEGVLRGIWHAARAINAGAADEVLPLSQIAGRVLDRLRATSASR